MAGSRKSSRDTGVGGRGVQGWAVIILTVTFATAALLLLYGLFVFWPASYDTPTPQATTTTATFLGVGVTLDRERSLLVMVALAGATGAMAHVLRSFFRYVGERQLVWSWVPSYVLTPFVGAVFATLTYIVVRAGLISGAGSGQGLGNPFGFAAIATLVGLFSGQAAEKLKQVFETLFAKAPGGRDALHGDVMFIHSFTPAEGTAGDDVSLVGVGLERATSVAFGGGATAAASWDQEAGVLRVQVPKAAETGPLTVTLDDASATTIDPFIVSDDVADDDAGDVSAPVDATGLLAGTVAIASGPVGGPAGSEGASAVDDAVMQPAIATAPVGDQPTGSGAAGSPANADDLGAALDDALGPVDDIAGPDDGQEDGLG